MQNWARDRERADAKRGQADQAAADAREAAEAAGEARTEYQTLRETFGAAVEDLERRLREVYSQLQRAAADRKTAEKQVRQWSTERGAYAEQVDEARRAVASQAPVQAAALQAFGALYAVEGLLQTVLDRPADSGEVAALTAAGAYTEGAVVPQSVQRLPASSPPDNPNSRYGIRPWWAGGPT